MPSAPRPKRRKALVISLIVVAALVVSLVGVELFFRNRATSCMESQFRSELGSDVSVGLSWKPVLLQMGGSIPYVTIDSTGPSFGPAQGMEVHARANDIQVTDSPDSSGTIGSSTADVTWSTEGILATVQSQPLGSLVDSVTADPSTGTLMFMVGPAGIADLTVRPTVQDGQVQVETVGAAILGFGLPTALVDGIVQTLTDSLQQYPLGMEPTTLAVTDDAVDLHLEGGQYVMPPQDPNAPQPECGIL
ncbi:LmeA family phospholipid-binding protein [Rhodococcus xishaensis]|uniref:DUF2993 domain-containing protein n=1 Tax=Rhodococcus xishaensis TaxID=2487364 RepID=A0A438ARR8_9NOCA|nr:DUF2993 domain-containing protein [Rhodococcus xishaensis]RVW01404.1 DUF2993 domain-containing protein [Rhodococcus xishaensis]